MLQGDQALRRLLDQCVLLIDPAPTAEQLQPASVDLRLGHEFKRFPSRWAAEEAGLWAIDLADTASLERLLVTERVPAGDTFVIGPGEFVLAHTLERVALRPQPAISAHPTPTALVAGRSSTARAGLIVETAGFIDPGFSGQITLELANLTPLPIRLTPGQRICQLVVLGTTPVERPYGPARGSRYHGQTGATASRGI